MESFESISFTTKYKRDEYFHNLRNSSFSLPEERQAVKYSDVAPLLVSGTTTPLLDEKGRQMYASIWVAAYPKEIHGHRVRAREKRKKSAGNQAE